jgi:hypothetical protein
MPPVCDRAAANGSGPLDPRPGPPARPPERHPDRDGGRARAAARRPAAGAELLRDFAADRTVSAPLTQRPGSAGAAAVAEPAAGLQPRPVFLPGADPAESQGAQLRRRRTAAAPRADRTPAERCPRGASTAPHRGAPGTRAPAERRRHPGDPHRRSAALQPRAPGAGATATGAPASSASPASGGASAGTPTPRAQAAASRTRAGSRSDASRPTPDDACTRRTGASRASARAASSPTASRATPAGPSDPRPAAATRVPSFRRAHAAPQVVVRGSSR